MSEHKPWKVLASKSVYRFDPWLSVERQKIAGVFNIPIDDIVWGHATPIQHLYGSGPA